jgi:CAAX protease family protein
MSENPEEPGSQEPPELPGPPDSRTLVVMLAVMVEGGLILTAWVAGWLVGASPLATFFWVPRDALLGVLATLPMLVLFLVCLRWPVGPLRRIRSLTAEVLRPLLAPCTLLDLFGISVLAGLGEEMLFRGVLQAAIRDWAGNPWVALALASVLFGLGHAITPAYVVFATLMGGYLGWLWQMSDNLLLVVITHALYDFVALVVMLRVWKGDRIPEEVISNQ